MSAATGSVQNWDRKAQEARAKARSMISPEAKALMLKVARHYKLLASETTKRRRKVTH